MTRVVGIVVTSLILSASLTTSITPSESPQAWYYYPTLRPIEQPTVDPLASYYSTVRPVERLAISSVEFPTERPLVRPTERPTVRPTERPEERSAAPWPQAPADSNAAVAPSFALDMLRPFRKSTIRRSYTPLPGGPVPSAEREQPRTAFTNQAYSVSVAPYDCFADVDGRRGKKKIRSTAATARHTNTVWPLPRLQPVDGRRFDVFRVPDDQLRLLYTVRRAAETTGATVKPMAMAADDRAYG